MLYSGAYSQPVDVYRKAQRDAWDERKGGTSNIPALHGYSKIHTIEEATVVPRTTEIVKASPDNAKRSYTGKTLYCSIHEDVESDDMIVYTDYAGKIQVFEVEGEGSNDYVSPYTGFEAGKELFLGRVRHRR